MDFAAQSVLVKFTSFSGKHHEIEPVMPFFCSRQIHLCLMDAENMFFSNSSLYCSAIQTSSIDAYDKI
jgi:hypothetical protein